MATKQLSIILLLLVIQALAGCTDTQVETRGTRTLFTAQYALDDQGFLKLSLEGPSWVRTRSDTVEELYQLVLEGSLGRIRYHLDADLAVHRVDLVCVSYMASCETQYIAYWARDVVPPLGLGWPDLHTRPSEWTTTEGSISLSIDSTYASAGDPLSTREGRFEYTENRMVPHRFEIKQTGGRGYLNGTLKAFEAGEDMFVALRNKPAVGGFTMRPTNVDPLYQDSPTFDGVTLDVVWQELLRNRPRANQILQDGGCLYDFAVRAGIPSFAGTPIEMRSVTYVISLLTAEGNEARFDVTRVTRAGIHEWRFYDSSENRNPLAVCSASEAGREFSDFVQAVRGMKVSSDGRLAEVAYRYWIFNEKPIVMYRAVWAPEVKERAEGSIGYPSYALRMDAQTGDFINMVAHPSDFIVLDA
jgi:hypothetical protein